MRIHKALRRTLADVAVAGIAASGLSATGAGAQSAETPGVTAKSVTLGYITVGSGPISPTYVGAVEAFEARIERENARGGVFGRKIKVESGDDQSAAANLTVAKDLVQNRKVFAVINNSPFAFLAYRFLKESGVPVIGSLADGKYYGEKGNEDVISVQGNISPAVGLAYDDAYRMMKKMGVTKTAAGGYSISPASSLGAKAVQDYAAPEVGLKAVYTNTSMDIGGDPGPIALAIKNSGADGLYMPINISDEVAVIQALQQNGVKMKSEVMVAGYGQDILDSPAAKNFGPEVIFRSTFKPVELKKDKAVKQFVADLKKYAHFTGAPNWGQYSGYITADLAIQAMKKAGKDLTRRNFIDAMRSMDKFDSAGLRCDIIDLSLKTFGKSPTTSCAYYTVIKNGKFALLNKGKPVDGKIVGPPDLIAANAAGNAGTAVATTAAP